MKRQDNVGLGWALPQESPEYRLAQWWFGISGQVEEESEKYQYIGSEYWYQKAEHKYETISINWRPKTTIINIPRIWDWPILQISQGYHTGPPIKAIAETIILSRNHQKNIWRKYGKKI